MDKLEQMRATLTALTNTGGVDPAYDSVEIDAKINGQIVDASPKFNEIRQMIGRESMNGQLSHIWRVRTSDNTSTVSGYSTSEGGSNTNTPAVGGKVQLTAVAKTARTDWEVENYFLLGSASAYNAISDELMNALETHIDDEEKEIINGPDTGSYGKAGNMLGLKQIVDSFSVTGATTAIYGKTRATTLTYLDAQGVDATASPAMSTAYLDKCLSAQKKVKGKPAYFLMSIDRKDEIDAILATKQRFAGTLNLEGGFTVTTYKGVPLISSVYADKLGSADTDTRILLIAKDNIVMKVLDETKQLGVDLGRADAQGGYIRTIEVLVAKDLTKNAFIDALAVPA